MVTPLTPVRRAARVLRAVRDQSHCLACGRPLAGNEERYGLRGGGSLHRACATYRVRAQISPSGVPPERGARPSGD